MPVIAETIRKAITIGSKVDYTVAETKRVAHTRDFLRREELTSEAIIRALRNPIELALAPEQLDVHHHSLKLAGIEFLRPDFRVRPDSDVRMAEAIPPEALAGR